MNKSDLVAVVASKANISKRAARRVVDSFIDGVVMSLQRGESVTISGFGTFSIDAGQTAEAGERRRDRSTKPDEDVSDLIDASRLAAQGFRTNPAMRRAVERYAIQQARRHYEKQGFQVDECGRPFDLQCRKGRQRLYVEVKGTQTSGAEVILTPNEVAFAQSNKMELFVLHSVQVRSRGKRLIVTGGVERVLAPWRPRPDELQPIAFSCSIALDSADRLTTRSSGRPDSLAGVQPSVLE